MNEIVAGVFDWVSHHAGIKHDVNSTYVAATSPAILIDPMEPDVDVSWFDENGRPEHIFMTNRLHDRGCSWFVEHFGCKIWCHHLGLHEFETMDLVVGDFDHGDVLPGGVTALEIGVLCPEETAFLIPVEEGVLAVGDAFIRYDGLGFVPDHLMGDDPEGVKAGMIAKFREHLVLEFDHLVMAHGDPWVGGGKAALEAFLDDASPK